MRGHCAALERIVARRVPYVVFPSGRSVTLETFELPDPAPNQILVRAAQTLISAGSERTALEASDSEDRTPGYSWAGVVEAAGSEVEGYQVGDRVITCLRHQAAGLVTLDPQADELEAYAGHIPDGVSDEWATFASLGDVAVHGVRRAGPCLGDSVAVFGQGVVGQLVTQFARLAGAYPVIALDLVDQRLEMARISGATHTVNAGRQNAVEAVRWLTRGEGARLVFMVARTPQILPDCLQAAAHGGTVALTGSPPGPVKIGLQEELLRKELDLIGTYQAGYPREPFHRFRWTRANNRAYVLELLQRGELRVDHLITHRVPYTEAPSAYEMIARGPEGWLAIVLDWTAAPSA